MKNTFAQAAVKLIQSGDRVLSTKCRHSALLIEGRAHMHYVVTEYGVAYLYGKNLNQRVVALMNIAHPAHRKELEKEIINRFGGRQFAVR